MKKIYRKEIWDKYLVNKELLDLLNKDNQLVVVESGEPPFDIVIGVPHHAPKGVNKICLKRAPREADTEAAILGLAVFTAAKEINLRCKIVIMANASGQDPNKRMNTPYSREMFKHKTSMLFEIHGSHLKTDYSIELSSGSNTISNPIRMGMIFIDHLKSIQEINNRNYSLGIQLKGGFISALIYRGGNDYSIGKLRFPAINTSTIFNAGKRKIPAFHLETKPIFRYTKQTSGELTEDGLLLSWTIAKSIKDYLKN